MNCQNNNQKIFFIKTLGCKVNQYESQAMREALLKSGFRECLSENIADIYIVNTCTVTERADKESRYLVGLFHRTNPNARIVVTGCYVEKDADNISFLPGVSNIVKNSEKSRIADILLRRTKGEGRETTAPQGMAITDFKGHSKAFVKIQDGCENSCSYCKIPLVRNRIISKPIKDIVKEVRGLIENGFKEIVLSGICLGAWGRDLSSSSIARSMGLESATLVDAIKALLKEVSGDFRIRLSSIEPKYVNDDLIGLISADKRICRHLHIPLQSGDDEILNRMNRPYTAQDYRSLIDRIRARVEGVAITTDILIGFPGETDAHFKNTLRFLRGILPARTHIFTYSRRDGTPAARESSEPIKKEVLYNRYNLLNVANLSASYLYRTGFVNRTLDVLVESKRDKSSGFLTGYTDNYIKVMFEGPDDLKKRVVSVTIEDISLTHTFGSCDHEIS